MGSTPHHPLYHRDYLAGGMQLLFLPFLALSPQYSQVVQLIKVPPTYHNTIRGQYLHVILDLGLVYTYVIIRDNV